MSASAHPDTHHDIYSKTIFGFWVYLLTDFILFATLFASYAVLHNNTFGGPSSKELFDMPLAFMQTLVLLVSSFTAGIGGVYAHRRKKWGAIFFFALTFLLGGAFLYKEWIEFSALISTGNGWQRNAFLSSFFTLVGTHGIHVVLGMLWTLVLVVPVLFGSMSGRDVRRLTCLKMFWQFLNVTWVLIFTFVYLLGVI